MDNQEQKQYQKFDWGEYEKKRAIEQEQYERIQKEIRETEERSRQTLESLEITFKNLDEAKAQARQTVENIDNFKKQFSDAMDKLLENIGKSMGANSIKADEQNPKTAKQVTVEQAQKLLTKNVLILCGAGLSHASGIPTFRGEDGYWTKGADKYQCQKVLTKDFLTNNPDLCWEWHKDFQKMLINKKPNAGHTAIANYKKKNPNTLIVSQNIDNMLTSILPQKQIKNGHFESIYEIHGNIKYMRCSQECTLEKDELATLYEMPDLTKNLRPKCPKCGEDARPHILFFDESYTNENCRIQELQDKYDAYDTIIVVGTMLETGCAKSTVCQFIKKKATIIEINPEPIIEVGNTYQIKGKSEEILPKLLK
ncbi:unnamed protein product [Paramecium octaurelia]|uniref:Deacetylase sirtuin-type domain-containing protein n=1 Tax=Paramecium octaurelia TaxID=43137 RepID=A0A8S1S154_PAROT|nr:unnamed protein product [Paramecium octaurelia]